MNPTPIRWLVCGVTLAMFACSKSSSPAASPAGLPKSAGPVVQHGAPRLVVQSFIDACRRSDARFLGDTLGPTENAAIRQLKVDAFKNEVSPAMKKVFTRYANASDTSMKAEAGAITVTVKVGSEEVAFHCKDVPPSGFFIVDFPIPQ